MPIPQGSEIFPTEVITSLTAQVNAVSSCAQLQEVAIEAIEEVLAPMKDAIAAELEQYAPLLALLSIPTNPTAVVTWVENLILDYLTPQFKPYISLASQLVALAAAVATLTDAINSKMAEFESCSITIPPMPV